MAISPRFAGISIFGQCQALPASQRWSSHCFAPSPTDAVLKLQVRRGLALLNPVWSWLNTLTDLRIGTIPQRRPACRGDARWLCLCPYVLQFLPDVGAAGDEGLWFASVRHRKGTTAGTPRRCVRSAPPTGCAPGVWLARGITPSTSAPWPTPLRAHRLASSVS